MDPQLMLTILKEMATAIEHLIQVAKNLNERLEAAEKR